MTLEVLEHVARNPQPSPKRALADLHISLHTWYAALERLEALDLVAIDRFPGVRTRRGVAVTPAGRRALEMAAGLRTAVDGSTAALEHRLRTAPPPAGSPEAGEVLVTLIERAGRRTNYAAMAKAVSEAEALDRPGEAAFGRGLAPFLRGDRDGARPHIEAALKQLPKTSRAYRRALYYHAAVLESSEDSRASYLAFSEARRLARAAGDDVTEADARFGISRLKAERNQWRDAKVHLDAALACARRAGLPALQAKLLASLCLVEFILDPLSGLERSQEGLEKAREAGSQIAAMHIRGNRALMFAYRGERKAAEREIRAAERMAREIGYDPGLNVQAAWFALARRIAAAPAFAYPGDIPREVSAMLALPPAPGGAKDKGAAKRRR